MSAPKKLMPACTFQRHVNAYDQPQAAAHHRFNPASARLPQHPPVLIHECSGARDAVSRPTLTHIGLRMQAVQTATTAVGANHQSPSTHGNSATSPAGMTVGSGDDTSDDDDDESFGNLRAARSLFVSQGGTSGVAEDLQRGSVALSLVDLIMVLYSVLSTKWEVVFSAGIIVGLVVSNALFMWAMWDRRLWIVTAVTVVLPLNAAVVFSVNTPDILLARMLVVLAEMAVLLRLRSLLQPVAFFL